MYLCKKIVYKGVFAGTDTILDQTSRVYVDVSTRRTSTKSRLESSLDADVNNLTFFYDPCVKLYKFGVRVCHYPSTINDIESTIARYVNNYLNFFFFDFF